jgi:hypothetical protein
MRLKSGENLNFKDFSSYGGPRLVARFVGNPAPLLIYYYYYYSKFYEIYETWKSKVFIFEKSAESKFKKQYIKFKKKIYKKLY